MQRGRAASQHTDLAQRIERSISRSRSASRTGGASPRAAVPEPAPMHANADRASMQVLLDAANAASSEGNAGMVAARGRAARRVSAHFSPEVEEQLRRRSAAGDARSSGGAGAIAHGAGGSSRPRSASGTPNTDALRRRFEESRSRSQSCRGASSPGVAPGVQAGACARADAAMCPDVNPFLSPAIVERARPGAPGAHGRPQHASPGALAFAAAGRGHGANGEPQGNVSAPKDSARQSPPGLPASVLDSLDDEIKQILRRDLSD